MSNNRTNSGVRNLRAMFEGSKDSISPPSRGRSPTGSDTTNSGPRPLSKVRTSFVAVERSGQMAPQLGMKKIGSDSEDTVGGTGSDEPEVAADSQQVNGETVQAGNGKDNKPSKQEEKKLPIGEEAAGEGSNNANDGPGQPLLTEPVSTTEHTSSRDGDKASLSSEEPTAPKLLPAPESEKTRTATGSLEETEGLGSLLKGSAFEPSPAEKKSMAPPNPSHKHESVKIPVKSKVGKSPLDGKSADMKHASKAESAKGDSKHPRPSAISTSRDTTAAKRSAKPSPAATTAKSPTTPTAPKTPVTPQRHPTSKTNSPRQQVHPKETAKAPLRKPSRTSLASTATTAQAAKTRQPAPSVSSNNVSKKAPKASPESKIRPKSPTRPVRLPASATAPTASSAAKLGGAAPAASTTSLARKPSTLKRDIKPPTSRVTAPTASTLQKKPSRASLPLQNGHERPKSRVSNAGSKAPDEGFLARMMRPTTSSASKTHEKVEPKTPPKKTAAAKPKSKRESTGMDGKGKGEEEDHDEVNHQNGLSDGASSSIPEHEVESEEPANQSVLSEETTA